MVKSLWSPLGMGTIVLLLEGRPLQCGGCTWTCNCYFASLGPCWATLQNWAWEGGSDIAGTSTVDPAPFWDPVRPSPILFPLSCSISSPLMTDLSHPGAEDVLPLMGKRRSSHWCYWQHTNLYAFRAPFAIGAVCFTTVSANGKKLRRSQL